MNFLAKQVLTIFMKSNIINLKVNNSNVNWFGGNDVHWQRKRIVRLKCAIWAE